MFLCFQIASFILKCSHSRKQIRQTLQSNRPDRVNTISCMKREKLVTFAKILFTHNFCIRNALLNLTFQVLGPNQVVPLLNISTVVETRSSWEISTQKKSTPLVPKSTKEMPAFLREYLLSNYLSVCIVTTNSGKKRDQHLLKRTLTKVLYTPKVLRRTKSHKKFYTKQK